LNSILGFSQVMLKGLDGPLNETQTKDLTAIQHSGQQLSQLLNDILELANLEVGSVELQRAPADMAGLLDGLQATLVSALVNPQLRLQMHIEPDLPAMMIDADRLRQVLTNLVITAAEMSREGVIIVSVARQAGQVEFDIIAPSVGVSANGHGGISIALSRRLVELHGGRLQTEQYAGSTRFWFTLPPYSSNVSQPGATDKTHGSLVPQGEATNAKHREAEL
jgi:signal transduction histidine kinase